jgi:hypothetical protein
MRIADRLVPVFDAQRGIPATMKPGGEESSTTRESNGAKATTRKSQTVRTLRDLPVGRVSEECVDAPMPLVFQAQLLGSKKRHIQSVALSSDTPARALKMEDPRSSRAFVAVDDCKARTSAETGAALIETCKMDGIDFLLKAADENLHLSAESRRLELHDGGKAMDGQTLDPNLSINMELAPRTRRIQLQCGSSVQQPAMIMPQLISQSPFIEPPFVWPTPQPQAGEAAAVRVADAEPQRQRFPSDEARYPCRICGHMFARRSAVVVHMRSHTGEKPHACEVCGKRFSQSGNRNVHMKKLHHRTSRVM